MTNEDIIIEFAAQHKMALDINGMRGTVKLGRNTYKSYDDAIAYIRKYEAFLKG